jgi:hypothetical protein
MALRKKMIPPGGQSYVYSHDDLNVLTDKIIKPAMNYGMVPVSEIYETHNFIGLCFSIDQPIQIDKIMETDEHNEQVQDAVSDQIRQETAVAIHQSDFNSKLPLSSLETEIIEQTKPGETRRYAKGVKVSNPN